jgi:hypothetical protein
VIDNPVAIPDAASTYKYASLGHTLGTISNDERDAVAGRTGRAAATVRSASSPTTSTRPPQVTGIRAADESRIGLPEGRRRRCRSSGRSPSPRPPPRCCAAPRPADRRRLRADLDRRPRAPGALLQPLRVRVPADEDFVGTANTVAARASRTSSTRSPRSTTTRARRRRIGEVAVRMDLRRGEQRAFLRSREAAAARAPGQKVRARVTLRRVRGGTITRSYR